MKKYIRGSQQNSLPEIYIKKNTTYPPIQLQLCDEATQRGVDLTSDTIEVEIKQFDITNDQMIELNPLGTVAAAASDGILSYELDPADTTIPGIYFLYFKITHHTTNLIEYVPAVHGLELVVF
jgi:hypothetical protein